MPRALFLADQLCPWENAAILPMLAHALAEYGCDVRVRLLGKGGEKEGGCYDGVPLTYVPGNRPFRAADVLALRRLIGETAPDWIHTWGPTACLWGRVAGVFFSKVPVTAEAPPLEEAPGGWRGWLFTQLHRHTARWIVSTASLGEAWVRRGVPPERVAVVPPPAFSLSNLAGEEGPWSELALQEDVPLIACVGPLVPRSGFKNAIWALDILRYVHPTAQLAILGRGPERHALAAFRDGIRLGEAILFLSDEKLLPSLLRRADVICFPAAVHDFPNLLPTVLALGKPVVAARWPSIESLVRDGENGLLVPPNDQPALAKALKKLLDDADLRRRLGEAARSSAPRFDFRAYLPAWFAEPSARSASPRG